MDFEMIAHNTITKKTQNCVAASVSVVHCIPLIAFTLEVMKTSDTSCGKLTPNRCGYFEA